MFFTALSSSGAVMQSSLNFVCVTEKKIDSRPYTTERTAKTPGQDERDKSTTYPESNQGDGEPEDPDHQDGLPPESVRSVTHR